MFQRLSSVGRQFCAYSRTAGLAFTGVFPQSSTAPPGAKDFLTAGRLEDLEVLITALDDSGIRVFGALRKTTAGIVQVTVPIPLAMKTLVSLRLSENVQTEGEITACERHDTSYFVDVRVQELRREPRFAVNDPARVTVLSVPDYPSLDGQIANLSKSGLAVMLPTAIPSGCQVKVELADGVLLGEVQYCRKADEEFTAGVAIETVLFSDNSAADKTQTAPPQVTGSLWGTLKRLYKAVVA